MHGVWEGPQSRDHGHYRLSDPLLPQALASAAAFPASWLRGVPPTDRARPAFVDPLEEEGLRVLGESRLRELSAPPGCEPPVVFGDGSGGPFLF